MKKRWKALIGIAVIIFFAGLILTVSLEQYFSWDASNVNQMQLWVSRVTLGHDELLNAYTTDVLGYYARAQENVNVDLVF